VLISAQLTLNSAQIKVHLEHVNTKKCSQSNFFMALEQYTFPQRLSAWRKRVGIHQYEAAKLLGVGRTYYSKLEGGKKQPGKFLLEKFEVIEHEPATMIRHELEERTDRRKQEAKASGYLRSQPLIGYAGRQLRVRRVPLIGWTQAGEAIDFEDVVDWETLDFVSVEINDPRAIAVRVRGDSMAPEIVEGDIVVLACSDRAEDENTVCARLRDEGVVLKRLKIVDPAARLFRLVSVNPAYLPMDRTEDQFLWIYPVDQIIKRARR